MAQHVYHVQTEDGRSFEVVTDDHHDDHHDHTFRDLLLDIISRTIANVISTRILHYNYKGRR